MRRRKRRRRRSRWPRQGREATTGLCFRESFSKNIDYDLNHRSLLMNSYQLQQQREQRKEVRIISIYNHRLFRRNGVDKVQKGLSSGSWRGRRVLVVSWSEAPSAKNWVWGPAFGYSVQGEPSSREIKAEEMFLKNIQNWCKIICCRD